MRIIIDIGHPAQINFFKNVIRRFDDDGADILITVLKRGKLPEIAKKELKNCKLKFVGRHRGNKWSIIFEGNILRFFQIFWICLTFRPDAGLSTGSFILGFALKLLRKPNLQFDDDPERKICVYLEKKTSTLLFFPAFYQNLQNERVGIYNALKEWAYLSPSYFIPNPEILNEYNLKPKQYIFIREVDVGSFNYLNQSPGGIAEMGFKFPSDIAVVLSLENKKNVKHYPPDWIILNEPVSDIHSLMYFSRLIISSGDSMAREGAMLGVNSVYCGSRIMQANEYIAQHASFEKMAPYELPDTILDIFNKNDDFQSIQESRRKTLTTKWCNVTEFIYDKFHSILQ